MDFTGCFQVQCAGMLIGAEGSGPLDPHTTPPGYSTAAVCFRLLGSGYDWAVKRESCRACSLIKGTALDSV